MGSRFQTSGLFSSVKDTMSTAIIRHFDEQYGFVIGADGLETKGSDYELVSDTTRKIFVSTMPARNAVSSRFPESMHET